MHPDMLECSNARTHVSFYKTKWSTADGTMSGNPVLKAEWPTALGTPTSFSASLCPVNSAGDADMMKQFCHAMGSVFEPGEETLACGPAIWHFAHSRSEAVR